MTFKPEISRVSIFNEALALLPSDPVSDPDEVSPEAVACRRFYKSVVAALLQVHHWGMATKRATLAAIANDRASEWGYAFAKPDDMAYPKALLDAGNVGYGGWLYERFTALLGGNRLFLVNGSTIYSRVQIATLEYTSFDVTEGDFSPLFKDIVVLGLAERICLPITKDEQRAQALASRFEFDRDRVVANDLNANQPTYGDKPTETELVRGAAMSGLWTGGYPLDPFANPANTGY